MAAGLSSPARRRSPMYIIAHQISFLLTGVGSTLGVQWLFYVGAASGTSFLVQLSLYIGMIMVGLLIPWMLKSRQEAAAHLYQDTEKLREVAVEGPIRQKSVAKLAVLDILANSTVTIGFSMIGSGMYQVIYSSVVVWCAILSYMFMGRLLAKMQWFAIFGTSMGLTLCALENMNQPASSSSASLTLGTAMTLCGTFFYACAYVYADHLLSQNQPAPLPARLCFYKGLYTTSLTLIWITFYTIPRIDKLIHIDSHVSLQTVLTRYALITASNATHAWNYYELLDNTGNVATGILQALRAVLVYGLSHVWYCSTDSAQCKYHAFTKPLPANRGTNNNTCRLHGQQRMRIHATTWRLWMGRNKHPAYYEG
ncbi:hypothetical protein VTP01DRAFT_9005 [Rhizomucor pusillus]|uniref:uncharacterized protein n=1 Tax=Rhizomucor pusillus TaxID=4840 RepID=UPI00374331FF